MRYRECVISVVAITVLAHGPAMLSAQQRPVRPSPESRAAARRLQVTPPPTPAESPTLNQQLLRAHVTRAEIERRKTATSVRPLAASAPPNGPEARQRAAQFAERPTAA